jgi:ribosome recycling factor
VFWSEISIKTVGISFDAESRQILIQTWDESYIEPIVKAILYSGLNLNPVVDQKSIRISFPPLSEEYRKDLLRILSQKREQARKTIRYWRQVVWDEIQEKFQAGEISEDDKYRGKDKLQDLIDEYNEKVEKLIEEKKKEIMQ